MAYGSIKVDNIIYDDSGDVTLPISSIQSSISGILTVTGDIKTTGGDVVAEAGVFIGTLGAEATPTYTFSGDNNTGLYASAADQISITTSGTAKLTVKSDGKVGIGTTAPDYGIHLHSSSSYLKISNSGTGEGGSDGLIVGIDGTGNCDIWNYENKFIRFATNNSEAMRIGSASETELTIYAGATNENYALIRGKYSNSNEYNRSEVRFGVENNSSGLGFLAFATGNNSATEKMRIDSSGRLLVGTTSSSKNATIVAQGNSDSATSKIGRAHV